MMKTIIEFSDGMKFKHDDAAPSIDVDAKTICLIDRESTVTSREFGFDEIKRIVFEPETTR